MAFLRIKYKEKNMRNMMNDEIKSTIDYYENFNNQDLLTKEEEKALVEKAYKGDTNAQNKLVTANIKFAVYYASKHKAESVSQDDAISACCIGLTLASKKVNPTYENTFICFASYYMMDELRKLNNGSNSLIQLPKQKYDRALKIRATYGKVRVLEADDKKCILLTAKELGISETEVYEYLNLTDNALSLESSLTSDESKSFDEFLSDDRYETPEQEFFSNTEIELINKILVQLDDKQREVMIRHFGLDGKGERRFAAVARELGYSRAWATNIGKKAIEKIMKYEDELKPLAA